MVMIMLAMALFLGLVATVVDVAILMMGREQLQIALDAAALAAAQELPDTTRAAATALDYFQRNGGNATVNVSFPDAKTVTVTASRTVNYVFARILGFSNATMQTTSTATTGQMGQAFNYTLFSGSTTTTLTLNGSQHYVGGDVHSNRDFVANGSKLTITGACEAVTTITTNGSQINIGQRVPNAPNVGMPDFAETIKQQAMQAGTYFAGNKTYNGSSVSVTSPIYVEGSLTINGSGFTGRGTIVASGSITFNGSSLRGSAGDALAFYSKNGSITINGSQATVEGILYAPHGSITLNGSNQTVHGRVIGQTVTVNGSQFTVSSSSGDLAALPANGVKLIH